MKRAKLTIWIIMEVISLGIIFIRPVFSGTSVSAAVTCRVPHLITLADGTKVASKSETSNQETKLISEPTENKESYAAEENPNFIQQEEVVSEDNAEVKLITTVCAK